MAAKGKRTSKRTPRKKGTAGTIKIEQKRGSRRGKASRRPAQMVFTRTNYLLLLLGVVMVVFGYIIMRLDNQVESLVSLYIAPLIILGGYLEIIYAILWRSNKTTPEAKAEEATIATAEAA